MAAPWLWRLEVVNVVRIKERRNLITSVQSNRYLHALESLEIQIFDEPQSRSLSELAMLARPHQLTSDDAVYLESAIRLRLPLFTLDHNLLKAGEAAGVEVVKPA